MSSLQSMIGTLPGYIICFAFMLLTGAQLAVLLRTFREKHGKARLIIALLHFFLGAFCLSVFLDYTYNVILTQYFGNVHPFEQWLLSLPWLLYAGLACVSAVVLLVYGRTFRWYRNTMLSIDSIRQAVDLLPTGILVSEPDGTVRLTNLRMTKLCRSLTGELLSDARRFWKQIEQTATEGLLIHTPEGETWQFVRSHITVDGKGYDQVTAFDMTEQYRATRELAGKNRHLKEVQKQIKAVAAKECSLAAAREVMNARMTVHDRMGAVLLSGKYYLDHPENVKEEELLRLLEFSNYFLLGEAEQPENEMDPLQKAVLEAARIGVTVKIQGRCSTDETIRRIIAQAVDQCAANAVRHAGGDLLHVVITEKQHNVTAVFSNNGRVPDGPITETGGLASLRKAVESAGGSMEIQSDPAFRLIISLSTLKQA